MIEAVHQQSIRSQNGSGERINHSRRQPFNTLPKLVDTGAGVSVISAVEEFPNVDWGKCIPLQERETTITTAEEYANFEFQPQWMKMKEYWDEEMERRHARQQQDANRPPLKVVIVPHSHNDPGWLKTFVNYFQADSRQILNNVITHMAKEYTDMTFIWTEISFLQMWWDQAHPIKQRVSEIFAN